MFQNSTREHASSLLNISDSFVHFYSFYFLFVYFIYQWISGCHWRVTSLAGTLW